MRKIMLTIAVTSVVAIGAVAIFLAMREPTLPNSPAVIDATGADIGGPFELTRADGTRISSDALIDGPTLLYFGYTFCPDICPVDTQVMVDAVSLLERNEIEVTPVFISIDPARDTPEVMGQYAELMHPRMIGLTGSAQDVKQAADAYRVYYQKQQSDSAAGYLMNHTAYTYFVRPDADPVIFKNGHPPEEMADVIARILTGEGLDRETAEAG